MSQNLVLQLDALVLNSVDRFVDILICYVLMASYLPFSTFESVASEFLVKSEHG